LHLSWDFGSIIRGRRDKPAKSRNETENDDGRGRNPARAATPVTASFPLVELRSSSVRIAPFAAFTIFRNPSPSPRKAIVDADE